MCAIGKKTQAANDHNVRVFRREWATFADGAIHASLGWHDSAESSRALPWPLSSLRYRGLDVTRPIF